MRCRIRLFLRISACVIFLAALSATALADGSHDRTQFGNDITIGPADRISEATCFGCSIRVRGHVDGDVTSFGGSVVLEDEADVGGDATSFAGSLRLDSGAKVGGDVTVFGGHLRRDPAALVGGDVTSFSGGLWMLVIFGLPLILMGGFIALVVWIIRLLITRTAAPSAQSIVVR